MNKVEELANWLETGEIEEIDLQESAAMLRQQQAEIGCYKIELELHKAMIQDLENALRKAQEKWNTDTLPK